MPKSGEIRGSHAEEKTAGTATVTLAISKAVLYEAYTRYIEAITKQFLCIATWVQRVMRTTDAPKDMRLEMRMD